MNDVRTLDLDTLTPESFAPYAQAVAWGFNEAPISNARLTQLHLEWARQDQHRLRGIWDDVAGLSDLPVATFASWDATVNAGADLVTANFITNVTVRPTHKRRGLLRSMMTLDLSEAVDRGVCLATLTATDAAIYGRFGFGRGTMRARVEIDSGARFALRVDTSGRCEFARPTEVLDERNTLFLAHHRTRRGSHARPSYYDVLDFDWTKQTDDHALRALVHLDDDDTIDGVAYFRIVDGGKAITVEDIQYANPNAEISLWQVLCGIELIEKVTCRTLDPLSALHWALRDPRVIKPTRLVDHFWLRVLDVPTAIEARGFEQDGEVTLDIDDPMGFTTGRYRITVEGGHAKVATADAEPDVSMESAELANLYSGFGDARALAAIGLIEGPGAAKVHDLFRVADDPWCSTAF